jgi:hypothetical protein
MLALGWLWWPERHVTRSKEADLRSAVCLISESTRARTMYLRVRLSAWFVLPSLLQAILARILHQGSGTWTDEPVRTSGALNSKTLRSVLCVLAK